MNHENKDYCVVLAIRFAIWMRTSHTYNATNRNNNINTQYDSN